MAYLDKDGLNISTIGIEFLFRNLGRKFVEKFMLKPNKVVIYQDVDV